MEYRNTTWSVACTIRAPEHVTNAFLKHYASLNPDRIYLFFDDAEFNTFDSTIAPGKIIAFTCDENYWKNVPKIHPTKNPGVRPSGIEIRQHTNMLYAREIMSSDWLLHVDSDEFLFAKKDVASVLSNYPSHVFSICLKNYEAVYTKAVEAGEEFSTNFFKTYHPDRDTLLKYYSEDIIEFSRGGFWGVETGKSFVRKSPDIFKMSVHRPVPFDPNLIANAKTNDLELLHFEGQSFELFKEKCYLRSKKNVAQLMPDRFSKRLEKIDEVIDLYGDEGLKELYNKFYVMKEEKLSSAINDGFVEEKHWLKDSVVSHDLLASNNPLEEERGQSLSLWQGIIARTFHNTYLAYDTESEKITSVTAFRLSQHKNFIPIEVQIVQDKFSILFYKTFMGAFYLSLGKRSKYLFSKDKKEATFFKVFTHKQVNYTFSLRSTSGYLKVSPNGEVSFNSQKALEWEMLNLKEVYPQL